MRQLPLLNTSGEFTVVDDDVFDQYHSIRWTKTSFRHSQTQYAGTWVKNDNGASAFLLLHRLIMGLTSGDGKHVDHIDGNGLNNLRSNLRIATPSQNHANQRLRVDSTTGFKGVSPHKASGKFQASITKACRLYPLGLYQTPCEAAYAYNIAADVLHGEFARLNIIPLDHVLAADRQTDIQQIVRQRLHYQEG